MRITILLLALSLTISLNSQVYKNPGATIDDRVDDLISRMTLAEKIGQMTQGERAYVGYAGDSIQKYYLGSVLSGGGSAPGSNTYQDWISMYNAFQQKAMATRLGIPILYGIDAVHGNNNVYGAVVFPHNIGLGCTRNPGLVEECARITAMEVAALGID